MRTRIRKWGNSLALRIPRAFASEAGLEHESQVEVTLHDGRIVVSRVHTPVFTLAELLENVTPENLHPEADTGPAAGREEW